MDAKSNPKDSLFERTGRIVYGNRFVGRTHEISEIRKYVVDNRANVAIIGMPRVGKSSLVWQSLMYCKEELISKHKLIPIYIDVSTTRNNYDFFGKMTSKAIREYTSIINKQTDKNISDISELIEKSSRIKNGSDQLDNDFYEFFEDFYQITSYQITYIFDEFDKAQNIFDAPDFLLLRETAYTPETNLSYVTVSRKSIKEIETKDKQNLSNFHGTFNKYIHLNVFSETDMIAYWNRIQSIFEFTKETMNEIIFVSGFHPLFLDLCCLQKISQPKVFLLENANLREKLYDEFDQIIEMLEEKGLLSIAKQIIIGPPINIDRQKIDKLLDFGFLRIVNIKQKSQILSTTYSITEEDAYVLFSDYFSQLFYFKYFLDIDYWPQWNQTENKLREVVELFCLSKYGNNWIETLPQENSDDVDWTFRWNTLKDRYLKNRRIYYNSNISSPIIVAETGELYFQFIKKYWTVWFSKIFNTIRDNELVFTNSMISTSNRSWDDIFNFLMKIRRPYAHTNTYILSQEDEIIAKGYCELVLNKIKKWEESGLKQEMIRSVTLEDGKYYEGIIVKVSNKYGFVLKVKIDCYPFLLSIISPKDNLRENNIVSFKAVAEPNRTDPNKIFWKADNVHQK